MSLPSSMWQDVGEPSADSPLTGALASQSTSLESHPMKPTAGMADAWQMLGSDTNGSSDSNGNTGTKSEQGQTPTDQSGNSGTGSGSGSGTDADATPVLTSGTMERTSFANVDGKQTLNVFVSGLPLDTTDRSLRELLKDYGNIVSTRVMVDAHTGLSRGFGFALFEDIDDGFRAIRELSNKVVNGSALRLSVSQHTGEVTETNQVFVRNIPLSVDSNELREWFNEFGNVEMFQLRSEGVANSGPGTHRRQPAQLYLLDVRYSTIPEAQRAIREVHGSRRYSKELPMLAKFAESVEARMSRRQRRSQERHVQSDARAMQQREDKKGAAIGGNGQRKKMQLGSAALNDNSDNSPADRSLTPQEQPMQGLMPNQQPGSPAAVPGMYPGGYPMVPMMYPGMPMPGVMPGMLPMAPMPGMMPMMPTTPEAWMALQQQQNNAMAMMWQQQQLSTQQAMMMQQQQQQQQQSQPPPPHPAAVGRRNQRE